MKLANIIQLKNDLKPFSVNCEISSLGLTVNTESVTIQFVKCGASDSVGTDGDSF